MASTSASRSDSRTTGEAESTTGDTIRQPRKSKISKKLLRQMYIDPEPSADGKMADLRKTIRIDLPKRQMRDQSLQQIRNAIESFLAALEKEKTKSCYPFIDDLSYKLDRGKIGIGFPIINSKCFAAHLERCKLKNEAVLQRTIMMSVFDHYHLDPMFDWTAESLWMQPGDSILPMIGPGDVAQPKPDLAISFSRDSFGKRYFYLTPELSKCICPDGGDNRFFPFLFMEVKKATAYLSAAFLDNLHTASQALWNMYMFVSKTGQEKAIRKFFDEVRVFSIVFNAEALDVRVHQAAPYKEEGKLSTVEFLFDTFVSLPLYDKDSACVLVNNILKEYGARKLHPILEPVFRDVTAILERESALEKSKAALKGNKRQSGLASTSSAKRLRSSGEPSQQPSQAGDESVRTGLTFVMERTQVSGDGQDQPASTGE